MPNNLAFDGRNSRATFPSYTLADGAEINIDVIATQRGVDSAEVFIGNSGSANNWCGFWFGSSVRLNVNGSNVDASVSITAGNTYSIRIYRTGSNVFVQVDGGTAVSVAVGAGFTVDQFGTFSTNESFSLAGRLDGTTTMTDSPSNRTYDFDQTSGSTTLVDTTNSQNGTLVNFDIGYGYIDSAEEAGILGDGADIWIMAGQSNMIGTNTIVGGTDDDYTGLGDFLMLGSSNNLAQAENPLDFSSVPAGSFGLWRTFASGLISNNLVNGRKQILVTVASSGSSMDSWITGQSNFNNAVTRTNAVMAMNAGNVIKGLLWSQGESDLGDSTAFHEGRLDNMQTGFKSQITGYDADTAVICAYLHPDVRISGSDAADVTAINDAIQNFSDGITNSKIVTTSDLTIKGDLLHYDAASDREVGTRFAGAANDIFGFSSSSQKLGIGIGIGI